jgi:four helix bundle protein
MDQPKIYNLEERTEVFSLSTRDFFRSISHDFINIEYIKQLIRSSGSVAANYIEANEKLGSNDLKMRIRICKKELKESKLWLKHLLIGNPQEEQRRKELIKETIELQNIFGAIIKKLEATPD